MQGPSSPRRLTSASGAQSAEVSLGGLAVVNVSGLSNGGVVAPILGHVLATSSCPSTSLQLPAAASSSPGGVDSDAEVSEPGVPLSFLQQIWNN